MTAARIAQTAGDGLAYGIQPATQLRASDSVTAWRNGVKVQVPLSALGAGAGLLRRAVLVSKAQVATLWSAPVQVLPAPAAGQFNLILGGLLQYNHGTAASLLQPSLVLTANAAQPAYNQDALGFFGVSDMNTVGEAGALQLIGQGNSAQSYIGGAVYLGTTDFDTGVYGPVASVAITAGGTGYALNDTGLLTDYANPDSPLVGNESTHDATYRVSAVSGGVVTGVVLTAPGLSYSNDLFATATGGGQPGVGTGLTLTATVTDCELASVLVEVLYTVLAAGA